MRKIISSFIIFSFVFSQALVLGAEFGEYQMTKYYAISQTLNNQKRINQMRAARYNRSATRNIRYPSAGNPYPNITRSTPVRTLSARERYSSKYYQSL